MDAIVIVDMQIGLLSGAPKYDLKGVVERINRLTAHVRSRSGSAIFVRHCGRTGDAFESRTPGWEFLPELQRHHSDVVLISMPGRSLRTTIGCGATSSLTGQSSLPTRASYFSR